MSRLWNTFVVIATGVALLGAAGWVLYQWLKKSDDPARLVFRWIIIVVVFGAMIAFAAAARDPLSKVLAVGVAATCGIVFTIIWGPSLIEAMARPFTNLFDGGDQEVVPEPFYSIAEARRKQGKYPEAVAEIRKQLARFPGDFTGMLKLAEVQAENLVDLAGAQVTIERLLIESERNPANFSLALNRLADWQLRFGQDPDSARAALERIIELFPETEHAYLATQRIAHLTTTEQLAEKREPHRIKLGQYQENIGLLQEPATARPPGEDPATIAAKLVGHLEQYPQDSEARERLALVYAEHYQRLDLAADQLEELLAQANLPMKQAVHWLNLLSDLRIKHAGDPLAARLALQRIVDLFP